MLSLEKTVKADDAVETITKFFNDLIGAWVPGLILAIGLVVMHLGPCYLKSFARFSDSAGVALTAAGVLFALGHLLLAVNEIAVKPLLNYLKIIGAFDEANSRLRQSYKLFGELVSSQQGGDPSVWQFHDLRNVALSISDEAALLGRRFMFVSLLCSGVGTGLLLIGIDFLVCLIFIPELLYKYDRVAPWGLQAILIFGSAAFLFKQADMFYARAMNTPFSVAFAELKFKRSLNVTSP